MAWKCMEAHLGDWLQALAEEDVDKVWQIWCCMAEEFLGKRSLGVIENVGGYRGRGCNRKPQLGHITAKQVKGKVGAQCFTERRYHRLARQLEELSRHLRQLSRLRVGSTPYSTQRLWRNILAGLSNIGSYSSLVGQLSNDRLPSSDQVQGLLAQVFHDAQQEAQKHRKARVQAWQSWIKQ
eukprot:5485618-Karenia_brevis.AAC.1